MAFVNEYVSEEKIREYGLESLYKKWLIWTPPGFRFAWTFDADRGAYLIPMESGREEDSNQIREVLFYKGVSWDVAVRNEEGGGRSFSEDPYRQIWGLVYIKHPDGGIVPEDEIIPILKEALTAYQVLGVDTPVDLNVVTRFTF